MSKPILIWGAGAIGGTLGAAFIRAGQDVIFVDNAKAHVDAINEKGLTVVGPIFEGTVKGRAFLPAELRGVYEHSFLCVKAGDTEDAAHAMVDHVTSDGYIVSAQNGLNERVIARIAGQNRVVGCFVNLQADYLEPGVVQYSRPGAAMIGELGGRFTDRAEDIYHLIKSLEPKAMVTNNISGFLWSKLIHDTLLFGVALTDDSIADILADEAARPVLRKLALEVATVAAINNIRAEPFDGFDPTAFGPLATPGQADKSFDDMVAHDRASCDIRHDLAMRRRRAEVDAQLSPVIEIGREMRVLTPLAMRLVEMTHEIQEDKRPLARINLDVLAEAAP
ncbi:ketopantoate reductase family protein [Neorhizobium lilium]|uniref:2-dehydropantoate 2-reductase n=1 Tax=Neorhizobium lilium TaxID=2503024 RepID=A0A3S3VQH1_9HYPH|nr:2-dehydropantoate 2-reductase N-terminal domain-containing protein [Neorhizobium lilium]RWX81790.1 ketopantoate reductase family protein [Neorhizobium lilium]